MIIHLLKNCKHKLIQYNQNRVKIRKIGFTNKIDKKKEIQQQYVSKFYYNGGKYFNN